MRKTLLWATAPMLAGVMAAAPARAQDASQPDASQQDASQIDLQSLLDRPVSSASKFNQRVADAPSAVTLITAEDIRRMGAVDLPDVLRMVAGLNLRVKSKGAYTVSVRNDQNLAPPKLLVLVDGRASLMESHDTPMWEALEVVLEQVERIEVVRGPGSALYGANAYDGVISITTRRPTGGTQVDASASVGEYGERRSTAVLRQTAGALRMDAFFQSSRSELRDPWTIGGVAESEAEDFLKGGLRLGWSNANGVDVELSGGAVDGEGMRLFSAANRQRGDSKMNYLQFNLSYPNLVSDASLSARVYRASRTVGNQVDRLDGEVMLDKPIGSQHRLIWGVTAKSVDSEPLPDTIPDEHSRFSYATYLQDVWTPSARWQLTGGIRFDHHPLAGASFSPRGTLLFKPSPMHTLRLSAGRAFRNPTLLENYLNMRVPINATLSTRVTGNEELEPEVITSYEVGYIGAPHPHVMVTADLYNNHQSRGIVTVPVEFMTLPNGAVIPTRSEFQNGLRREATGGELGVVVQARDWLFFQTNYAYEYLTDRAAEGDEERALYTTPRHKVNAELAVRPLRPLWVDLIYRAASRTEPNAATDLPAQGIFDLNTRVAIWRGLSASVFAQNLLDREYRDVLGGEVLGRRVVGKLSVSF